MRELISKFSPKPQCLLVLGCERLPKKPSSSFKKTLHLQPQSPANPACLHLPRLRASPWLVPWSPGPAVRQPAEGWHQLAWQQMGHQGSWRERWGGGRDGAWEKKICASASSAGHIRGKEPEQCLRGAAEGEDATEKSQPCPKTKVRQRRQMSR